MEYYNRITPNYLRAIKKSYGRYLLKLELLTENETVVGEIIQPLSIDSAGQLNINYQQITRRSCSLALINVDNKYAPNQNSWFWYRRKFKLWYGLSYGEESWWFSQGVFITNGANGDCHLINIEAVDKGGMLDGTLKYNLLESKYVFEKGSKIAQLVRDTLLLSDGRNVIDPTPPLIDKIFEDAEIEKEITINENAYIGELFKTLAETYGADVFYDTNGRLNFTRLVDGDRVDGYRYMGAQYEFSDEDKMYLISSLNYSYDAVNAVTVYTNITVQKNDNSAAIAECQAALREVEREIEEKGINIYQTVYGNIDTNNRQLLRWTSQNLNRFQEEYESWGYTSEELAGSISTVMGTSAEFDGVEIAFSPILQTTEGAVLLDEYTVSEYIWGLIDLAGESWTNERLLSLDTEGLDFDGVVIKNLIADIGETAIKTGESMHYVGRYGALALAQAELEAEYKKSGNVENQTYTAYNTNPRSPINVTAIGVRRMESIEISYIDNLSPEEMRDRCKQYADYNLIKCSLPQLAINFTAVPVPHLDVNKTILITDKTKDIESGTYVVQSITMPLSAGEMNVEATSIDVLPNDTDIERGGDLIG